MAGEGGLRPEPLDACRLADELGRRQAAATLERQETRTQGLDQAVDLALEPVDGGGQLADPGDQVAGQAGDRPGLVGQPSLEAAQNLGPVERPRSGLLVEHELVEVPAQPVLVLGARAYQVVAVVDQQAHVALGTVEGGHWQVGFAQRCAGHREGVDRIALARLAGRPPGAGHQLGWDADDSLASDQQVTLEGSRQVAAVLEGERPLWPLGGPAADLQVTGPGRAHLLLGHLPSGLVDRHEGMTALVQIGSDDDHSGVSSFTRGDG